MNDLRMVEMGLDEVDETDFIHKIHNAKRVQKVLEGKKHSIK